MSLLNPFFLLGSLALAVPVLIHLVRNDRSEIVRFSSLMFLLRIPKQAIRQRRFRNLLLMAMRLLLLALLVLAFARPYLTETTAAIVPTGQSRGVVLMLDNSYSLTYGTNFERMKSEAASRIQGLEPGDVAALVAFNRGATVLSVPSGNPEELQFLVDALEPSSDETNYYEAFSLADRVLGQLEGYNRQLVVVSDFQRNGWNRPSRESVIDPDVEVEWVDLGIENPENTGIDSVGVDATAFNRTYDGQLMARINNHRLADAASVNVRLEIGGRLIESKAVEVPAESSVLVEFTGFELPLGYAQGRVTIEDEDPLMIDNEFIFVIHRRDRLELLIVDSGQARQSMFLENVFEASPELPFIVQRVTADRLTESMLDAAEVVILNDVRRLPSDALKNKLNERRAEGQGQLVIFGSNTDVDWWNTFQEIPVRLLSKVFVLRDRDEPYYSLTTYQRSHELFSAFEAQASSLTLNSAQFSAYVDLEPREGAEVIAKLEDGSPIMVESGGEDEKLLVLGSSVDNVWNDFPLKTSFVAIVAETVRYLAGYREGDAWYQLGEAVRLPAADRESIVLITPEGERLSLGEASETGGRFFAPELTGFYEVRVGSEISYAAVNAPSSEGILEQMPPDELLSSVRRREGEVRQGALLSEAEGDDYARNQNLWWYLFLFALLVGIGEIYLGNRVTESMNDRRSPVPSR